MGMVIGKPLSVGSVGLSEPLPILEYLNAFFRPQVSESDSSAFTAIKIQSVVLQFLIEHADQVNPPSPQIRFSVLPLLL